MPTISRMSQRLTWRPGVNQRTTRGFIRKGATGAPSLAQHFLNSFPVHFVTAFCLYAARGKRHIIDSGFGRTTSNPVLAACSKGTKGGRPRMAIKAEGVTRAAEARKKEQAQYW